MLAPEIIELYLALTCDEVELRETHSAAVNLSKNCFLYLMTKSVLSSCEENATGRGSANVRKWKDKQQPQLFWWCWPMGKPLSRIQSVRVG